MERSLLLKTCKKRGFSAPANKRQKWHNESHIPEKSTFITPFWGSPAGLEHRKALGKVSHFQCAINESHGVGLEKYPSFL